VQSCGLGEHDEEESGAEGHALHEALRARCRDPVGEQHGQQSADRDEPAREHREGEHAQGAEAVETLTSEGRELVDDQGGPDMLEGVAVIGARLASTT